MRQEQPDRPAPFAVGDRIVATFAGDAPGVVDYVEWAPYRQWGRPGWSIGFRLDRSPRLPRVSYDGAGLQRAEVPA